MLKPGIALASGPSGEGNREMRPPPAASSAVEIPPRVHAIQPVGSFSMRIFHKARETQRKSETWRLCLLR